MKMYFDENLTDELLAELRTPDRQEVRAILDKAREGRGLDLAETGKLLVVENEDDLAEMIKTAGEVKRLIYGNRIVLFAPLYLSNSCVNNCLYCGYRKDNLQLARKNLSREEVLGEAGALAGQGHKRVLLVCGESPGPWVLEGLCGIIREIYSTLDIRRINVNIAPLSEEEFKMLKDSGIGTYQLFQETYHRPSYNYFHPTGPKADYYWRISAFDRAMRAGIDDVGLGVLLGLYNYRYEVLALLQHALYLENMYGAGPHTVSVPRLQPAPGAVVREYPWRLSDRDFKKVVAVLRLALPYTGIILSTREPVALRNELLHIGVSQISAGSSTAPGGYLKPGDEAVQFTVADYRTLDEVVRCICEAGYLPSFCTACYRRERTGEKFMELAKTGEIKGLCQPNALLTFKENLLDFASAATRQAGEALINDALLEMDLPVRNTVKDKLNRISRGDRDLYF
ncbi:MAG: [FeFe] hydrogenase H-cluster radical SAM maturase HydG [Bacillota bacterium]